MGRPASSRAAGAPSDGRPQRIRQVACRAGPAVLAAIDFHPLHPARIGVEHLGLESGRTRHQLAAHRHVSGAHDQIAAERIDFLRRVADVELLADHGAHIFEARAPGGEERAVALARHRRRLRLVVLVGDVADDQLDQVLDRDQTVAAAVFVDDEREVNARRLHLGEQIERRHRRRRVEDFADDLGGGQRHRKIDVGKIEIGRQRRLAFFGGGRIERRARGHERQEVADVDHAGRIVERVVVDHETRMAGAGEHFDQLADGDALLHGDDVGPRHHDALDPALAQGEDVLEHRGFCGREAGFALFSSQHEFKIGARRGRSPAEQDAHHAHEPAIVRLCGLRHDHGKASMLALARFAAVGGLGHGSGQGGLSVSGVGFRPWPGADRGRE